MVALLRDLKDLCTPEVTSLQSEMQARSFVNKEIMRRSCADEVVIELLCECFTPFGDPNGLFVGAEVSLGNGVVDESKASTAHHQMAPSAMRWLVHEFLPSAFEFLEHYSRGMPRNQMRVSQHVLLIASFMRWGVSGVPKALAGIFESNRELCKQIDKAVIEMVVDYLAYGPKGDVVANRPRRLPGGGSSFNQIQGKSGSFIVPPAPRPVFDVWCLRFLETAFNVNGHMVRQNQRYILRCLTQHGPQNLTLTPEERRRHENRQDGDDSFNTDAGGLLLDQNGNKRELALQLFRGEEGARVREQARKARAGVEDPMQDVLEYNISLLRLLRFLSLDVGPVDLKVLRSLFNPSEMAIDVIGSSALGRAKAETLDLFCALYLRQGLRQKSSDMVANAAMWTLLDYLNEQLKIADTSALAGSLERSHGGDTLALPAMRPKGVEAQKRATVELELLLADHWAPLLDAILSNTTIIQLMTSANRQTLEDIFVRLIGLIELVSKLPEEPFLDADTLGSPRTQRSLDEIKIKETFVTVQALLKKLVSMKHPPIRVNVVIEGKADLLRDMCDIAYDLQQREQRKKHKIPRYTFQRPLEPTASLVTARKLQCFAQAFLNLVDPIVDANTTPEQYEETMRNEAAEEAGEEEEEETDGDNDGIGEFEGPEVRQELLHLGHVITSLFTEFRLMSEYQRGKEEAASGRDILMPTEALIELMSSSSRANVKEWEYQTMILLRLIRGLVLNWKNSVSDELPPRWILHSIPKLVIEMISTSPGDRIAMMALDLAISILQISPPWPVQQSFYDALVASGRAASDFMGMLLNRIRRGEEEALELKRFYDQLYLNVGENDGEKMMELMHVYETRIRGQARCLHTQLVQGLRGEVCPTSHVEAIFRFLQLLCEGHNMRWQNYLRAQNNGIRNVDLVSATANYVIFCAPHICPLIVQLPVRALQSLAEFVQNPCRGNQRVLVDTALVASANNILNISSIGKDINQRKANVGQLVKEVAKHVHIKSEEVILQLVEKKMEQAVRKYPPAIYALKANTITCLLSLLECVDEPYIPGRMLETLSGEALRENMNILLLKYRPELVLERLASGDMSPEHVPLDDAGTDDDVSKVKEKLGRNSRISRVESKLHSHGASIK